MFLQILVCFYATYESGWETPASTPVECLCGMGDFFLSTSNFRYNLAGTQSRTNYVLKLIFVEILQVSLCESLSNQMKQKLILKNIQGKI